MAQAKSGDALAHAARVKLMLARQRGAVVLDGGRGSCGGHGGGHGGGRGHATVLFAGVPRACVWVQGREAHQTHPPRRRPSEEPVGDSNGVGGEAVVWVKEGRVEASPRGARSEDGTMVLLLLPLLPPPCHCCRRCYQHWCCCEQLFFPSPLQRRWRVGPPRRRLALGQAARRCSATRGSWRGSRC